MEQGTASARRRLGGILVAAAATVTVIALPSSADAHTELAGSVPAAGSVSKTLSGVRLEFAGPVLPELTAVVVTRGGKGVPVAEPVIEGATVEAAVDGAAQAGQYTVAYRTVAADGHPITGSFSFEVVRPAESAAPPRPRREEAVTAADPGSAPAGPASQVERAPTSSAGVDPSPLGILGILGAGAAAVALGAGLLRRRSLG